MKEDTDPFYSRDVFDRMGTADSSLMTGEKCFKWSQVMTTATWKLMQSVERRVEGHGPQLTNTEMRIHGLCLMLLFVLGKANKVQLELTRGNQHLQEANESLKRKVHRLELRIVPQMEGQLRALEERISRLEQEGSRRLSRGQSGSSSSGSLRSGQRARRMGGPPRIPDENHHLLRTATPFSPVGMIAQVQGVCHTVLTGGHLVEIESSEEEEAPESSDSYRSVPLAPVNELPS